MVTSTASQSPATWSLNGTIRLYWELARRGYRRWATYRGATLAGVFTNSVFGFMRGYVLIALFTSRPHVGGYTVTDALTYVWLTQGILMTVYLWGWNEIGERVRSGDIVSDLQRPVDFQAYWLSQDLGRAVYHCIFRGVPPFLLGAIAFHLYYPANPMTYVFFVVSLTLGVCVSFAMRFIINILAFWLLDHRGVTTMVTGVWTFLSGSVLPLALFPHPWRLVAEGLPFAGMIQTPVDVFLEKPQGVDLLWILGKQVVWTALLIVVGRWLLARATRKLVLQGG